MLQQQPVLVRNISHQEVRKSSHGNNYCTKHTSSLSLFLSMGNILALLRDLGKIFVAWDLFVKLDSIGARILMLDLIIVVGMSGIDDG